MASVSPFDDEFEKMVTELLPRFDNNRSKVIRESIRYLYESEMTIEKHNTLVNMFEACTLFIMGCGLFVFAISMFMNIPLLMSVAIVLLFTSGLLIMILTVINNKKIKKKERGDAI
jgi:Flp pilus assembly protein TadB